MTFLFLKFGVMSCNATVTTGAVAAAALDAIQQTAGGWSDAELPATGAAAGAQVGGSADVVTTSLGADLGYMTMSSMPSSSSREMDTPSRADWSSSMQSSGRGRGGGEGDSEGLDTDEDGEDLAASRNSIMAGTEETEGKEPGRGGTRHVTASRNSIMAGTEEAEGEEPGRGGTRHVTASRNSIVAGTEEEAEKTEVEQPGR